MDEVNGVGKVKVNVRLAEWFQPFVEAQSNITRAAVASGAHPDLMNQAMTGMLEKLIMEAVRVEVAPIEGE
ncbi:hypothetical protein [Paenibacillus sp. RUD330]|uniref:hypothetical protein n=1 Tax=Paenibacillus sp. RUD330 TaxID=2023772 RepID=UPI000B92B585|nr:hypothetical protein [Paenibacillus sp. RUD330]ASS66563.1 hypothetical protein CIC07_10625 [Paenibacillus sp. RUD330]